MYSTDQTKDLQNHSLSLLKTIDTISSNQVLLLREVLHFHEHRYYILNDPLIADYEYDQLYKALEKIEMQNPELIVSGSPTQRVAKGLTKDFPTVQHLVPMLSLENSYDEDDLSDWDRKAKELANQNVIEYCVEPKFDGASISLIYENDVLVRGATRGNGVEGDDVTANIIQIRSIPLLAKFSSYGIFQIEVRGEVLMSKSSFKKYNDQLAEHHLPPLANPRNSAAGSLRIKDPNEVKRRNLEAFIYHVSYYTTLDGSTVSVDENNQSDLKIPASLPDALKTHSGTLEMLWNLGFRSPQKERKVCKGIKEVIDFCPAFEEQRDHMPYEIDGMVIKVNKIELQDKLGMTTHHPRWAMAFKFKARQGTSILRKIEFQVGRTGSITPVAKIDPVAIGGVTVTSISLFNEEVVREKDIRIGDTVLVERAGDVIPYIVKSMAALRTGSEEPIRFPECCPVCGDKLFKPEEEAVWRCINVNCKAQVVERIIHFVSKDAMDIRSLGEANVRKFFDMGLLPGIPSVYALPFEKIGELEGFGKKSMTNLQSAIEHSKQQPLHRLIYALGIRYVGENTAKTLANVVTHILDFKNYSAEELQTLEDVGVKVASSIFQFFSNEDNVQVLEKLEQLGVNLKNHKKQIIKGDTLKGVTFLFTGTLSQVKRSEAEEMVEEKGGSILNGVSSKLNYLVVGEDAGSKLEKAKKIQTIHIINENDFLQMIRQ